MDICRGRARGVGSGVVDLHGVVDEPGPVSDGSFGLIAHCGGQRVDDGTMVRSAMGLRSWSCGGLKERWMPLSSRKAAKPWDMRPPSWSVRSSLNFGRPSDLPSSSVGVPTVASNWAFTRAKAARTSPLALRGSNHTNREYSSIKIAAYMYPPIDRGKGPLMSRWILPGSGVGVGSEPE